MTVRQVHSPLGMGRSLIDHDERNRDYPARELITPGLPLVSRTWRRGGPYDQDGTGWCVAETGKGMLNTAPFSAFAPYDLRAAYKVPAIYRWAQNHDEWPGRSPDYEGTSARGLCRGLRRHALIETFRWNFSLQETLETVSQWGPCGIGGDWKTGMDDISSEGIVHYTGETRGGHEWELFGLDVDRELGIAMNSWGDGWGDRGRFYIPFSDLEALLNDAGDSVTFEVVVQR